MTPNGSARKKPHAHHRNRPPFGHCRKSCACAELCRIVPVREYDHKLISVHEQSTPHCLYFPNIQRRRGGRTKVVMTFDDADLLEMCGIVLDGGVAFDDSDDEAAAKPWPDKNRTLLHSLSSNGEDHNRRPAPPCDASDDDDALEEEAVPNSLPPLGAVRPQPKVNRYDPFHRSALQNALVLTSHSLRLHLSDAHL